MFTGFVGRITTNLAEGCEHVLAVKSNKKIIVAIDKRISCSTGEILAILHRAPPFPVPHR